jgi:predicted O-methyltransferase YrrM
MTEGWRAVDDYIAGKLLGEDEVLTAALANNEAQGLPAIDVSPAQGKLLYLLARLGGARRILEVGTLGGYSTIWLARALSDDGQVVTLEIDPHHAAVASANVERAELGARVEIRVGPALETLAALAEEGVAPFDFVFIDADKQRNADYVAAAIGLSQPGATIIVDNVVRGGRVIEADSADPMVQGTRRLFDMLAAEPRLEATAIQTVGAKDWDGFVLARVR